MATKTEAFVQKLMESDLGRRLMAEAENEAAGQEERQSKAGHLAALRAGRAAFMEALRQEVVEAEGRLKAARKELREATANYNQTYASTYGRGWRYNQDILEAEDYLFRTASARLKTALQSAQDRLERLRSARVERDSFPDIPSAVRLAESDRPTIWCCSRAGARDCRH